MFPDIANVEFIRDALWRHKGTGDASIMIGAGFSRNAEVVSPSARPMPNWAEMAEKLCAQLYGGDAARYNAALKEASATSGFLTLAQEYQVAFGPSALNSKIRDLVPDLDYRPGDLHKRLLRLPWADVFSTNWDTLLERTRVDVFERNYEVITTVEQIPFAIQPRIVKLHGTFPAHEPFIFTEEEYRTFPIDFAPFVNLVQQSMMETIFCLLGFSGDDPNFLHWSGWVRDNLGKKAPKIYLVGWLELSVHRRRMLEDRNVMPVDLAALPQGKDWPRDRRHRYATDWFIRALEAGKPYDFSNWPAEPHTSLPPPPYLAPIPSVASELPRKEEMPWPSHPPPPKEDRIEALRKAVAVWRHNRRLYPGWVIAPEHVRQRLWDITWSWISEILFVLEHLSLLEKLRTLSELAWRMNKTLFPLFSEFEDAAFAVIDTVDRAAGTVGGSAVPGEADWLELLSGSNELALVLARNARRIGDSGRFDRALSYLTPAAIHVVELGHAITYERCLWDLAAGNLQSLNARLQAWKLNEADPVWLLRKAGIFAELRDNRSACDILGSALIQMRRMRRRDTDDLFSLSRESWALYLALAYRSGRFLTGSPELPGDLPESFQRWRELGAVDCDAFSEYRALARSLERARPPESEATRRRGFDADRESVTYHLAGGPSSSARAAYAMTLLSEEAGIPPAANRVLLFESGLAEATKVLSTDEPWLTVSVAIRIGNDSLLDDVLSRARVATLPAAQIPLLRYGMLNRLAHCISMLASTTSPLDDWVHLTGIAMEALSRLALRLPLHRLKQLFSETIGYYRSPIIRRSSIFLGERVGKLLGRILETLPNAEIEVALSDLFGLPLVHEAGLEADETRWTEPVALLPEGFKPTGPIDSSLSPLVARLIDAAAGTDNANREAALLRLYKLWDWNSLSEEDIRKFGEALWAPVHLGERGLPSHTRFLPSAFLRLPAPANVDQRARISSYLAWLIEQSDGNPLERLHAIGVLLSEANRLGTPLELPQSVIPAVSDLINVWASTRLSPGLPGLFSREEDRRERDALIGVKVLLPKLELTEPLTVAIRDKTSDLNGNRQRAVRAYALFPTVIQLLPDCEEILSSQLRRALGSDLETEAALAVSALYDWARDSMQAPDKYTQPSKDLFREIGIAIAARRAAVLRVALDIARWVLDEGPREITEIVAGDCEYGLNALLEEASYARRDAPFDIPGIRAACVRLASAMQRAGLGSGLGASGWISAAAIDPLPEVRNALSQRLA
jgi:hypothetical protein